MSIVQQISVATHPIVLRFAEMFPAQLAGYEMHAKRMEKDLRHVDGSRSHLNQILIGPKDWQKQALEEIDLMRHENLVAELDALKKRNRTREMVDRAREGLKDPWRSTSSGPLREVILTANKDWFEDPAAPSLLGFPQVEREAEFKEKAVEWLKTRFGDDVIHARVDHDERTCHIHAIIMPRAEKTSKRRGRQQLLQPSVHPLLKDYEKAQDDVGEFFSEIGLRRGERSKAARREAMQAGLPSPEVREHVPPSRWREEEWRRVKEVSDKLEAERGALDRKADDVRQAQVDLAKESLGVSAARKAVQDREAKVAEREARADAIIAAAEALENDLVEFDDHGAARLRDPSEVQLEAQKLILDRFARGGERSNSLLGRFGAIVARLSRRAEDRANARVDAEISAARRAIAAANDLWRKAMMSLTPEGRRNLKGAVVREEKAFFDARAELGEQEKLQSWTKANPIRD